MVKSAAINLYINRFIFKRDSLLRKNVSGNLNQDEWDESSTPLTHLTDQDHTVCRAESRQGMTILFERGLISFLNRKMRKLFSFFRKIY